MRQFTKSIHSNSMKLMEWMISEPLRSLRVQFISIRHQFNFNALNWLSGWIEWITPFTFVQLPLNQSILSLLRFNEWMWFDFIGPFTAPAVWTRFTRGRCAPFHYTSFINHPISSISVKLNEMDWFIELVTFIAVVSFSLPFTIHSIRLHFFHS